MALFGSSEAEDISTFQAVVDGNGTNPFRLASSPTLMALQVGVLAEEITAIVAAADLVESCVEVAVIVAVPRIELAGVKVTPVPEATPDVALKVPFADGLTVKFTVFAKAPVPVTVGVHVEVCVARMEDGLHKSEIEVIAGGAVVTVIFAEPVTAVFPACAE
jgi:hypothetical protein